ncbi:MAG: hypothetical protein K6G36_01080 [Candidatus Saccharibacteria bacterium]|nr:hypothetical protein [Candidatus Saccharibacteria bacterium]
MSDEYKDIQILEVREEEERRKEEAWPPVRNYAHEHAMHELEESLKIGPSVDAVIFFWLPLAIILVAAMFLGGGA